MRCTKGSHSSDKPVGQGFFGKSMVCILNIAVHMSRQSNRGVLCQI